MKLFAPSMLGLSSSLACVHCNSTLFEKSHRYFDDIGSVHSDLHVCNVRLVQTIQLMFIC